MRGDEWAKGVLNIEVKLGVDELSLTTSEFDDALFDSSATETRWFKYSLSTRDCEEEGCDDYKYVYASLYVGEKTLQLTRVAPYSHTSETLTCILTN